MTDKINVLNKGYVRLVDHMGTDLSTTDGFPSVNGVPGYV